jgi:hypothetical protein
LSRIYSDSWIRTLFFFAGSTPNYKQAPKNWNKTIITWLEYGFIQSKVNPGICVFIKEGELYVLALYVDDNIIVGPTGSFIVGFKSAFGVRFNVQDLGPMSWLLGMTVERDCGNRIIMIGLHHTS